MSELSIPGQIIMHCRKWVVQNHMSFMTDEYKNDFLEGKYDDDPRFLRAILADFPLENG